MSAQMFTVVVANPWKSWMIVPLGDTRRALYELMFVRQPVEPIRRLTCLRELPVSSPQASKELSTGSPLTAIDFSKPV